MSSQATEPHPPGLPWVHTHRRLFVSWQHPETRRIVPVGRLDRCPNPAGVLYRFQYLRNALNVEGFRPFVSFPEIGRVYEQRELFPLFSNRMMPRTRADYGLFVGSLGLNIDDDPFEVLARSQGRRETDTIEVFPEPTVIDRIASCHFLVRSIRYVEHAQDVIDRLNIGDRLQVQPEPDNPADDRAVLLACDTGERIGYLPQFLTSLVHEAIHLGESDRIRVSVEHVGERSGPIHFRLLCRIQSPWPHDYPVFFGAEYEAAADSSR